MRNRIILIYGYEDFQLRPNTKLKDPTVVNIISPKRCDVIAARRSCEWDWALIKHSELPPVQEGGESPRYLYSNARTAFPFLFTDTNPLLYRKFA